MTDDAIRSETSEPEAAPTRRHLLRNVAIGAAGAAAASVAGLVGAKPAAANDPNDLNLTAATNPHATRTGADYTGPNVASSFTIESGPTAANNDTILNNNFANGGTALIGIANSGGPQAIGVIGWSKQPLGTGLVGFTGGAGAYGGEFFGGLAEVRLRPGRRGTYYLDQRPSGGRTVRGRDQHAVVVHPRRDARDLARARRRHVERRLPRHQPPARLRQPHGARRQAAGRRGPHHLRRHRGQRRGDSHRRHRRVDDVHRHRDRGQRRVRVSAAGRDPVWGTSSINWFGPAQNLATTVISALGGDRQLNLLGGVAPTHVVVDLTGFYR